MAEPTAYVDELTKVAQQGVASIAAGFEKPDDDFTPVFTYVDGGGKAVIVGFDMYAKNDAEAERMKDRYVALMERILRRDRANAASLMISAWTASLPADTPKEMLEGGGRSFPRPSRMPNRKETLWLQVTDGSRYEVWMADLIRHENAPPTVGEWKHEIEMTGAMGRFHLHDIFRRALGM